MSSPSDTLPSPQLSPPIALSPGASLIIFNHLNPVQQDIITDIKAMTAFAALIWRWTLQPIPRECSLDNIRQCLVARASQQGHEGILYSNDIAQVHSRLFDLEELEKRAGKRSIGVQTDKVPPKRLLRGASPVITDPVDVIGLCSEFEGEFISQPESHVTGFMRSSDVSSCSLGQIPPTPQPGPTLFITNSYDLPPGEVNIGRLEASNGFNAIVKGEDKRSDEAINTQSERGASLYGPDRRPIQVSHPFSNSSEFLWARSHPHNESMTYRTMMEEAYPYEYDNGALASFI